MGKRTKKEIIDDLTKAGVDRETAKKLAESAGLRGKKAKEFLKVRTAGWGFFPRKGTWG